MCLHRASFNSVPFYSLKGRDPPDVQYEKELRMELSSIIQLILVSLNSACLSLPVSRWYVQELFKVQEKAAQFKVGGMKSLQKSLTCGSCTLL